MRRKEIDMDEYISREALVKFIDERGAGLGITVANCCNFKDIVKMIPAADVVPRNELVKEIADFIYDGEIEGLNIEMNGRYLGKNDFIKEFTTPKGGAE